MALTKREYTTVKITKKAENTVVQGHPWVFDGELTEIDGTLTDGALVDVLSHKGSYLGTGFYNSHSKIKIRLISRNVNDKFDEAFFERRLRYAWEYRKTVMGGDLNCCRVIFGEADTFPGLTVDKFNDILVTQTLSLGIEQRKDIIFHAVVDYLRECGETVACLYERNDVAVRGKILFSLCCIKS